MLQAHCGRTERSVCKLPLSTATGPPTVVFSSSMAVRLQKPAAVPVDSVPAKRMTPPSASYVLCTSFRLSLALFRLLSNRLAFTSSENPIAEPVDGCSHAGGSRSSTLRDDSMFLLLAPKYYVQKRDRCGKGVRGKLCTPTVR